jgi:hypothetical protein
LRQHGKRNASIPTTRTSPSSQSQSSGASAIGSQPSRGAELHISASSAAASHDCIDLAQLPRRLLVVRAAGTAHRLALGQDSDFGYILNAADKIAGDGLEKLPFDVAFAPGSSPQSLEYPHSILH